MERQKIELLAGMRTDQQNESLSVPDSNNSIILIEAGLSESSFRCDEKSVIWKRAKKGDKDVIFSIPNDHSDVS